MILCFLYLLTFFNRCLALKVITIFSGFWQQIILCTTHSNSPTFEIFFLSVILIRSLFEFIRYVSKFIWHYLKRKTKKKLVSQSVFAINFMCKTSARFSGETGLYQLNFFFHTFILQNIFLVSNNKQLCKYYRIVLYLKYYT